MGSRRIIKVLTDLQAGTVSIWVEDRDTGEIRKFILTDTQCWDSGIWYDGYNSRLAEMEEE